MSNTIQLDYAKGRRVWSVLAIIAIIAGLSSGPVAGPAPTTLASHKDRSAGPVHSSGWLCSGRFGPIQNNSMCDNLRAFTRCKSRARLELRKRILRVIHWRQDEVCGLAEVV